MFLAILAIARRIVDPSVDDVQGIFHVLETINVEDEMF